MTKWTWSDEEIGHITQWAGQAGQIALQHFRKVNWQRKTDNTLFTQADLEIDQFLTEKIRAAYPDDGLISEESARIENPQNKSNIWVIDPLDGTTAFTLGLPGWGISIGLLHQGQPYFGLYYMPLIDDMTYTSAPDQICDNSGRNLEYVVRQGWGEHGFLAASTGAQYDYQINLRSLRTLGSVGTNLIYTARGVAAAAFLSKARLWDLVAGAAILHQAGGKLCYLSGKKIDYLQLIDGALAPEPIVAGYPGLLANLSKFIGGKRVDQ